jgi:predicted AAA+ superfamily ATPase
MINLYEKHQRLIGTSKTDFRRNLIDEIDWNERMLAIKGARGVGKSTLICSL